MQHWANKCHHGSARDKVTSWPTEPAVKSVHALQQQQSAPKKGGSCMGKLSGKGRSRVLGTSLQQDNEQPRTEKQPQLQHEGQQALTAKLGPKPRGHSSINLLF
jgi:hypothetical protein